MSLLGMIQGVPSKFTQGFRWTITFITKYWIWLLLICFVSGNVLIIIFFEDGVFKNISIAIISIIIGLHGISLTEFRKNEEKKRQIISKQREIIKRFNSYFQQKLGLELSFGNLNFVEGERKILEKALKKIFPRRREIRKVNSLMLCYYCKKWDQTKAAEDYQQITIQSENIGLKYGDETLDIQTFLDDYNDLLHEEPNELTSQQLLREFAEYYYKDLQFFDIKDELNQSKNLHETLVSIIREGKLSTYGINRDVVDRLQRDLAASNLKQNTYLILGNKIPEKLKNYFKSLPGFSGSIYYTRNIDDISGRLFGGYIVRPPDAHSPDQFLANIKRKVGRHRDHFLITIITLDFLNSLIYTMPADQSFTTEGLQNCYEAIDWFKTGYIMEESALWNEIAKSNISANELLSLIPFNIFCRGILTCEQTFMIQHYNDIKESLAVDELSDWRNVNPGLLRDRVIGFGQPEYSEDEYNNTLELDNFANREEAINVRILGLCNSIIEGAQSFHESTRYQD